MLRRVKHHYKRRKAITEESQRVKKKSLIKRILRLPDYKCCIWQLLQSWTIDFQIFSSKSLSDQIYPDYILKSNQLNPLKLYLSAKMNSFQLIAQQTICVILFSCTVINTSNMICQEWRILYTASGLARRWNVRANRDVTRIN